MKKWSLPSQQVPELPGELARLETYLKNREKLVQALENEIAALTNAVYQISASLAQLAGKFVQLNPWLVWFVISRSKSWYFGP